MFFLKHLTPLKIKVHTHIKIQVNETFRVSILVFRLKYATRIIYRVSTKGLHTFKIIQKTNAAYLELHTYTSR
jgi:hypothetical protein